MMTAASPLHPDNLLRLLRDLVRFPTVNPPGGATCDSVNVKLAVVF